MKTQVFDLTQNEPPRRKCPIAPNLTSPTFDGCVDNRGFSGPNLTHEISALPMLTAVLSPRSMEKDPAGAGWRCSGSCCFVAMIAAGGGLTSRDLWGYSITGARSSLVGALYSCAAPLLLPLLLLTPPPSVRRILDDDALVGCLVCESLRNSAALWSVDHDCSRCTLSSADAAAATTSGARSIEGLKAPRRSAVTGGPSPTGAPEVGAPTGVG